MVKAKDAGWDLPRRKPVTKEVIERAIRAEEATAAVEHRARAAWFDELRDIIVVVLDDGRLFGADRSHFPAFQDAAPQHLRGLRATGDGVFLAVEDLDLHVNVDGLVNRLIEESPAAVRRVAGRLAGMATSDIKAASSARNGRLGGRPRKEAGKAPEHA